MEGGINPWAGEVLLVLNGEPLVCRLTLGALAEAEADLASHGGLIALINRFEEGSYRASDVMAVLLAGLRGGGWAGSTGMLGASRIEGGLREAVRVAALLLARAFALPELPHEPAL